MRKFNGFKDYFSLIYTAFLLILIIEFTQRLQIYLYHGKLSEILSVHALFVVALFTLAALLSLILTLAQKLFSPKSFALYVLVEFTCLITFSLSYTYAFLSMERSFLILRYLWATGIAPLLITLTILYLYLKRFGEIRRKLTQALPKLSGIFLIISLLSFVRVGTAAILYFGAKSAYMEGVTPARLLQSSTSSPNIIIITFDALTVKDMSLYGYQRKTTPSLEEFANESFVFENMYSNFVSTTPTLLSLFTSKYPWTHEIYSPGTYLKRGRDESLFSILPEYAILSVIGADSANPMLIGLGTKNLKIKSKIPASHFLGKLDLLLYNIFHNTIPLNEFPLLSKISPPRESDRLFITRSPKGEEGGYILDSKVTLNMARESLNKPRDKPFFAWIHIFAPNIHVARPYATNPPPPFLYTFSDRNAKISDEVWVNGRYSSALQAEVDKLRGRYDECILYADYCLGEFFSELKRKNLFENSLIIITSDHGESFEKGWRGHFTSCLSNFAIQVPLLIHLPWQKKGRRIAAAAETVDIAPTILEVLGRTPPKWMEGESLIPYLNGTKTEAQKPKFSCWKFEENRRFMIAKKEKVIAVISGGYKLIYNLMDGSAELYDIMKDKNENNNLYLQEQAAAQKLKELIPANIF